MELFRASNQWANRPDDERFSSLIELRDACRAYRESSKQSTVNLADIRVEADKGEILLTGKTGIPARMTHWAFGQLCTKVGAPASYLRDLPATLASQNLNHGLARSKFVEEALDGSLEPTKAKLLFHNHDDLILRALTSTKYTRIWNYEIVDRLLPLQEFGWIIPPARPARAGQIGARPATQEDVLQSGGNSFLSINVGDLIAPAGLYASDHDLFAFMINEKFRIKDGTDEGLSRGFFIENSEVGASSLKLVTYLFRHVCGNHIVWGAENVQELRIRHVGSADKRYQQELVAELRRYAESSVSDTEAKIIACQTTDLGKTKEEVLDFIFGKNILSRKRAEEAYDDAEAHSEDGSPRSAWGYAQAITRMSQQNPHADERVKMDRAAAKVLEFAF